MTIIAPTVGRIVLYNSATGLEDDNSMVKAGGSLAAIIVRVWDAETVNLAVFDSNGILHQRHKVHLRQADKTAPQGGGYCEWMPYQVGQAAKLEELEEKNKKLEDEKGAAVALNKPAKPTKIISSN